MGYENALFSYGGELGDYATYKVHGIVNSPEAVAALECIRELYKFTPPNWGKRLLPREQPGDYREPGGDDMNYFAFFPALANKATNPYADVTGYFANPPARAASRHGARRPGHLDRLLLQEAGGGVQVPQWFIKDETQKKWGELGGYTCSAAVLKSDEFRKATPYNEAFYQTMFMVKDFWAVPEYGELLEPDEEPHRSLCREWPGNRQRGARRRRQGLG